MGISHSFSEFRNKLKIEKVWIFALIAHFPLIYFDIIVPNGNLFSFKTQRQSKIKLKIIKKCLVLKCFNDVWWVVVSDDSRIDDNCFVLKQTGISIKQKVSNNLKLHFLCKGNKGFLDRAFHDFDGFITVLKF